MGLFLEAPESHGASFFSDSMNREVAQPVRYAFDSEFVKYFGDKGVEEVRKAAQILEAVRPPQE